ncbi:MAG: hypothetical protein CM1200mP2_01370 [Planctomycetaceae bacterium]|nr:MAG: hypothetical protein CM1200mP2_01370 [Planctomycetaceae bacterium]
MQVVSPHPNNSDIIRALASSITPRLQAMKICQQIDRAVRTRTSKRFSRYSGIVATPIRQKKGMKTRAPTIIAGTQPIHSKLATAIPWS